MEKNRRHFLFTILATLAALVFLSVYMMTTFYNNARKDALALGESTLAQEREQMERYMNRAFDIIQITSMEVEYLIGQKEKPETILAFLENESAYCTKYIDENFTGVYGWINGEYLDGIGWVPEEGYVPTERVWYTDAIKAGGKPAIISPYLDAQTGTIMISISRMLSDNESVISLDISMDTVQQLTELIQLNGQGYGFIVDREGFVIAHSDSGEKGKYYKEFADTKLLLESVEASGGESFDIEINGEKIRVFSDTILDDWTVVMVVDNKGLLADLRQLMFQSGLMCFLVFIVIAGFCFFEMNKTNRYMTELQKSQEELKRLNDTVLQVLAKTIDAKDKYTKGHSERVADYSRELAKRMGKSEEEQEKIYKSALLHDVGKIRIPDKIINKPGKLTDEEYAYIKLHPVSGYHILKSFSKDQIIATGAKFHHERYDGKGYPNGLAGNNIPEHARIIGVADTYDAMASNRSYRDALPQNVIRSELEGGKGTQFDPEIADIMLKMVDEDKDYRMRQDDEIQKTILVVDDDETCVELVANMLEEQSVYRILSAGSGKEALEVLENNRVDLVLLDIEMPEMDGFETFENMKKNHNIPVVFMTATKELTVIDRARAAGAEDYMTKPVVSQTLFETVHGALS